VALPAAVEAKRRILDNVSCAVAEYSTVTETTESLLKSVDGAAAKKEPFGTAGEQLREQQVGNSSAAYNQLSVPNIYIMFLIENCISHCFILSVRLQLHRQLLY